MDQIEEQGNVTEIENGSVSQQTVQQGQSIQHSSPQNITSMQPPQMIQTPSVIQQQSVIQTAQSAVQQLQPSNLQAQMQLSQGIQGVHDPADDSALDEESKKRRDILSRRPSYRKIFNDLSGSDNPTKIEAIPEDPGQGDGAESASTIVTSSISYQQPSQTVALPQTIHIVTSGDSVQSLQAMPTGMSTQSAPAAVVQYQQQQDGQQYIYTAAPGDVQQVQVSNTGTMYTIPTGNQQYIRGQIPQGVVLNSPGMQSNPQQLAEDATRKRELRLMKNREAAKECRRKKKEYVKCLENRVAVLENQNKTLIEELKTLKDLYCHKSE